MNNINDFLEPVQQEYLGIPIRTERSLVDEILRQDIYNQDTVTDPNATYRQIEVIVYEPSTDLETGDNKVTITIPFDGRLVAAQAFVTTASTSGVVEVSLEDKNANDILAGWLTVDANEFGSENAVNQPVVDSRYNSFVRYDQIKVNLDSIGTGTQGLVIQLYFIVDKFYYE